MTKGRKALIGAVVCGAIAAVILAVAFLRSGDRATMHRRVSASGMQAAGATPRAKLGVVGGEASDSGGEEIEAAVQSMLNKVQQEIDVEVRGKDIQEAKRIYWAKEDESLARMPKYEEVKEEMRKRATELLKSVKPGDTDAILAITRKELDTFWGDGGLLLPENCVHGYTARAVLEIALEQNGDDFRLLGGLNEAIGTMMPLYSAGLRANDEAFRTLWPVVDKERRLILAGKVPPSPEAMMAMSDWAYLAPYMNKGDVRVSTPAFEWLAANADRGGWGSMKRYWQGAAENTKAGQADGVINLWSTAYDGTTGWVLLEAKNGRRLLSFCGPPEYRAKAIKTWDPSRRLDVTRGKTDGQAR